MPGTSSHLQQKDMCAWQQWNCYSPQNPEDTQTDMPPQNAPPDELQQYIKQLATRIVNMDLDVLRTAYPEYRREYGHHHNPHPHKRFPYIHCLPPICALGVQLSWTAPQDRLAVLLEEQTA